MQGWFGSFLFANKSSPFSWKSCWGWCDIRVSVDSWAGIGGWPSSRDNTLLGFVVLWSDNSIPSTSPNAFIRETYKYNSYVYVIHSSSLTRLCIRTGPHALTAVEFLNYQQWIPSTTVVRIVVPIFMLGLLNKQSL